jgi:hypothetical protein
MWSHICDQFKISSVGRSEKHSASGRMQHASGVRSPEFNLFGAVPATPESLDEGG